MVRNNQFLPRGEILALIVTLDKCPNFPPFSKLAGSGQVLCRSIVQITMMIFNFKCLSVGLNAHMTVM